MHFVLKPFALHTLGSDSHCVALGLSAVAESVKEGEAGFGFMWGTGQRELEVVVSTPDCLGIYKRYSLPVVFRERLLGGSITQLFQKRSNAENKFLVRWVRL